MNEQIVHDIRSHTIQWPRDAVFYHIYPLGCLGAPVRNPFHGPPSDRISLLSAWIDYLVDLGINAICLGPVFEASGHGYDVADYFQVDRRLGDQQALGALSDALHRNGIRILLDAVFNHTGRDFWAFRDVLERGLSSPYCTWYHLDFARRSPYGDPFHYKGWSGNYNLVKLDVSNPAVREHLFKAVLWWIERFDIDGLRIDAAADLDLDFQRDLASHCGSAKRDFWLIGEVVGGDYRRWAYPGGLSSTTNYEAYKSLWSSHNDRNYFEIAYSLDRQFCPNGIYRELPLYSFADNHDVDRIATKLVDPAHLYPLYTLLLTMPGVPSIYYGSEWGIEGRKVLGTDSPLRPVFDPATIRPMATHADLHRVIKTLVALRRRLAPLRYGDYLQLHVAHEQFAFLRRDRDASVVVAVNAGDRPVDLPLVVPGSHGERLVDQLNDGESFNIRSDGRCLLPLYPRWARVLA
jgi:glycosidase